VGERRGRGKLRGRLALLGKLRRRESVVMNGMRVGVVYLFEDGSIGLMTTKSFSFLILSYDTYLYGLELGDFIFLQGF
jgi:hypothetical protein